MAHPCHRIRQHSSGRLGTLCAKSKSTARRGEAGGRLAVKRHHEERAEEMHAVVSRKVYSVRVHEHVTPNMCDYIQARYRHCILLIELSAAWLKKLHPSTKSNKNWKVENEKVLFVLMK